MRGVRLEGEKKNKIKGLKLSLALCHIILHSPDASSIKACVALLFVGYLWVCVFPLADEIVRRR